MCSSRLFCPNHVFSLCHSLTIFYISHLLVRFLFLALARFNSHFIRAVYYIPFGRTSLSLQRLAVGLLFMSSQNDILLNLSKVANIFHLSSFLQTFNSSTTDTALFPYLTLSECHATCDSNTLEYNI